MILFQSIVYGPIHSRRLGISLGINLMPTTRKICSFDCLYCECGFLEHNQTSRGALPKRIDVQHKLEQKLCTMSATNEKLDVITFSGNGEPTMHPDFFNIVNDTISLRNTYYPSAKVSVLSNATQLHRATIMEALQKVDNRILKLDSAIDSTMRLIDQPQESNSNVENIIKYLRLFNGHFTLQTCFLRGEYNGQSVDNTTEKELQAWYKVVEDLQPEQVMIYAIDRETPIKSLQKVSLDEMTLIAKPLIEKGIKVIISA